MIEAHTTRFDSVSLQVLCNAAFPLAFPVHSYPQPKSTVNLLFPRFEGFDSVRHRSQPMTKPAEYSDWYDAAGNLRPDAPKKDSVSAPQRKTEVA